MIRSKSTEPCDLNRGIGCIVETYSGWLTCNIQFLNRLEPLRKVAQRISPFSVALFTKKLAEAERSLKFGHHIQFHDTNFLVKTPGRMECIIMNCIPTIWAGKKASPSASDGTCQPRRKETMPPSMEKWLNSLLFQPFHILVTFRAFHRSLRRVFFSFSLRLHLRVGVTLISFLSLPVVSTREGFTHFPIGSRRVSAPSTPCCFIQVHLLAPRTSPWRWRQRGQPKRWYPTVTLHGVASQPKRPRLDSLPPWKPQLS
jgi:hypothetical protein